jgi:hypothetical protein
MMPLTGVGVGVGSSVSSGRADSPIRIGVKIGLL